MGTLSALIEHNRSDNDFAMRNSLAACSYEDSEEYKIFSPIDINIKPHHQPQTLSLDAMLKRKALIPKATQPLQNLIPWSLQSSSFSSGQGVVCTAADTTAVSTPTQAWRNNSTTRTTSFWPFPLLLLPAILVSLHHQQAAAAAAWTVHPSRPILPLCCKNTGHRFHGRPSRNSMLWMANAKASASKKSKKASSGSSSGSVKGFGTSTASSSFSVSFKKDDIELDRSKESLLFTNQFLGTAVRETIQRTALAYKSIPYLSTESASQSVIDAAAAPAVATTSTATIVDDATTRDDKLSPVPVTTAFKLRGVIATQNIPKGQDIINIPYELAIDLGPESADPTIPAVNFLRDYCSVMQERTASDKSHKTTNSPRYYYYQMLPAYTSVDCLSSADFFSNAALDALQSPIMVDDISTRRAQVQRRFELDIRCTEFPLWVDGISTVTVDHLQWAVWIVTSRVLTVQTDTPSQSVRLLIPYLDMCNHDRSSRHVLTGRAVPGGRLKVVAGTSVKAGDDICICYGGGVTGNDKFLPEYGFLDETATSAVASSLSLDGYTLVAYELLGKRIPGSGKAGTVLSLADRQRGLEALQATTIEQDEQLLQVTNDASIRTAIQYRLGVKKALAKLSQI